MYLKYQGCKTFPIDENKFPYKTHIIIFIQEEFIECISWCNVEFTEDANSWDYTCILNLFNEVTCQFLFANQEDLCLFSLRYCNLTTQ